MKPSVFEYEAPETLPEAIALLADHGDHAKILAGGQSLIPAMNFRVTAPGLLIDLNRLGELDYINLDNAGILHIGAMTRQRTVERSDLIKRHSFLLHETLPFVAHPQIRNRGTVGGSLVHADPAAELPVIMVALDARFVLTSSRGIREVAAREFFTGMFTVAAQPDEILTEIWISARPDQRFGSAFMEIARRRGDYAMMGVAALVSLDDDGYCTAAELAYLNAGDRPLRAPEIASGLIGGKADARAFEAVARNAARDAIDPMGSLHASSDYQRHLAEVLTRRALGLAFERASASRPSRIS